MAARKDSARTPVIRIVGFALKPANKSLCRDMLQNVLKNGPQDVDYDWSASEASIAVSGPW
jgi:hypothetical protein